MRKILLFLGLFFCFSCCVQKQEDTLLIQVKCRNRNVFDRNGEDYIKLWINDTLKFRGVYQVNTKDSIDAFYGMPVAVINKFNRDSLKIRIRITSLDSVLFGKKQVIDSVFYYPIDSIPELVISDRRILYPYSYSGDFAIFDPIRDYGFWIID